MGAVERTILPSVIFAVTCLIILTPGFISIPVVTSVANELVIWGQIMGNMALALGIINLILIHGNDITKRKGNWIYYLVMFFILGTMATTGLSDLTLKNPQFVWMYNNIYTNCTGAFFGAVLFYLVSCTFRVVRIRNFESALLAIAATLTVLMSSPVMCSLWPGFPILGEWVQSVFNTGAFRGITIGAAVGFVGLALRMFLGRERSWMGAGRTSGEG